MDEEPFDDPDEFEEDDWFDPFPMVVYAKRNGKCLNKKATSIRRIKKATFSLDPAQTFREF